MNLFCIPHRKDLIAFIRIQFVNTVDLKHLGGYGYGPHTVVILHIIF